MRFLLGEMFPNDAAVRLWSAGHDAVDVRESELLGAPDADIFQRAVDDDRVLVTENVRDFAPLVGERADAGRPTVPVVFVLKRSLPTGAAAMGHAVAERLGAWDEKNPEPYRHVHWLD